jgi:xanthine dehydrogenase accessory factor
MTEHTSGSGTDGERGPATSPAKVEQAAAAFDRQGRPYARVTVVRREPPVSATVGDRALVTPDGDVVGWIGGAECAQSVVIEEATAALAEGEPVLVGLAPDPDDVDRPGLEAYPMTCHSGGTLELFVEPVTPVPRLVVVGESPIAQALARLAGELTYEVTVATGDGHDREMPGASRTVAAADAETIATAIDGAEYVVVASMGEYDERGVVAALQAGASYVGLVASDERRGEFAASVAPRLDVDPETVADALTTPVGLDIGARTPEEIAVSILAELVGLRRGVDGPIEFAVADAPIEDVEGAAEPDQAEDERNTGDETVVDPVCGMDVVVGEAAATVAHDGETYHFCGQGCADAFADDPGGYLDGEVTSSG